LSFYELSKEQRQQLVEQINRELLVCFQRNQPDGIVAWFADEDTYIRKAAYQSTGKIWKSNPDMREGVVLAMDNLCGHAQEKVRQTAINAAGEIGIYDFKTVEHLFDRGLADEHYIVRNAVIGSVKKMGQKNPVPVLQWARKYLHHPDKEIRREICHGIELRGRTHPQDILPLLRELQFDTTARVRKTLVHVLGQIAYKPGCLDTVLTDLKTWDNQELVRNALDEIVDVHRRYADFAAMTADQATACIGRYFS